jgi:hypothetical protein
MNWLKVLVGFSAIIIAGCAAYFSVTGLAVLFAGASIPVMVMAGSLEFAKLATATYLKQKWNDISGFNKWYLTISVGVLMIITSAGIFGYLSNAFQQQNLSLQKVERDIAVYQTQITKNDAEINRFTTQINNLQQIRNSQEQNISKIVERNGSTSRLTQMVKNADVEIKTISKRIDDLTIQNNIALDSINSIKNNNIELEREVGGFRFVAESFDVPLNSVVKFFILLIVIVFDPLAIALIIAFNGLVDKKNMYGESGPLVEKEYQIYEDVEKIKQKAALIKMMQDDTELGLYDTVVENNFQNEDVSGKNLSIEEPTDGIVENSLQNNSLDIDGDGIISADELAADENGDGVIDEAEMRKWYENGGWQTPFEGKPYYYHPWFDWRKTERWINDRSAINHWLNFRGGTQSALEEYAKTYPTDFTSKKY